MDTTDLMRIRRVTVDMGIPVRMWDVTHYRGRKRVGPHHFSEQAACQWVHKNGLHHIGGCWHTSPTQRDQAV